MATITTTTYLDGGTARTAGEAMTINGGRLICRTDTRWHANSLATSSSLTGTLGSVTISSTLGGAYEIDATQVRWLAYTGGSGGVPAIGATVSQGGVSGYVLGVWTTGEMLPNWPGGTLPFEGFIKFREVTGGSFAAGALTGITATALGADKVGWIEVVHDQSATLTVPRLGEFKTRGDWFELGTTTGLLFEYFQIPCTGMSADTAGEIPGVWVETEVTDEYEFWPSLSVVNGLNVLANTEASPTCKFVFSIGAGRIMFTGDLTYQLAYTPPAGRRVRIPNIIARQATTAQRDYNVAAHATIASRPEFAVTGAGNVDVENFSGDWYFNLLQPYAVKLHHFATFDSLLIAECATAISLLDGGNGMSRSLDINSLVLTSNFAGGTITDWYCPRFSVGTNDHALIMTYCKGIVMTNVQSGHITYARSTGYPFNISYCDGVELHDCRSFNGQVYTLTSTNILIENHDHVDRYKGNTNTTTGTYAVNIATKCNNVLVDGITFGINALLANKHPYLGVVGITACSNVTVRNIGSRGAILNGGTANQPAFIYVSGGNNDSIRIQRCYMQPTRTGAVSTINSDNNCQYDHVYGDYADTLALASLNTRARAMGGTNSVVAQTSVYGTHVSDYFLGDTLGRVVLILNEPTAATTSNVSIVAGNPRFTSAGGLTLQATTDEITITQDYYALGHTAFANIIPVVTGTNVTYSSGARWGNHDIWYDIDTGSGFGGTWKNFHHSVLSLETIDPAVGFRMKYRLKCAVASTSNNLQFIRFQTVSTLAAQTDNLYPLDTNTLSFTGVPFGTDMVVLAAGTTTILHSVDGFSGNMVEGGSFDSAADLVPWDQGTAGISLVSGSMAVTSPAAGNYPGRGQLITGFVVGYQYTLKGKLWKASDVTVDAHIDLANHPVIVQTASTTPYAFELTFTALQTSDVLAVYLGGDPCPEGWQVFADDLEITGGPAPAYSFEFQGAQNVDVGFIQGGYVPYYLRNLALTASDLILPITLTRDRNYQE